MDTIASVPVPSPVLRSPWHSPVPYLFGGLAAMLGLIAFALLILACSYWKFFGRLENNTGDRDLERGETDSDEKPKFVMQFEEKLAVIMAGQSMPTFLATPVSSRASSFKSECSSGDETGKMNSIKEGKVMVEGSMDQIQPGSMERDATLS